MAGPGTARQTQGFQDTFGGHLFNTVDYTGVAAYVNGTGELLDLRIFGFPNTIETIIGESVSIAGTYYVVCQPKGIGICQWYARWFVVATGVEVANGVNLTAQTVKIAAIGY